MKMRLAVCLSMMLLCQLFFAKRCSAAGTQASVTEVSTGVGELLGRTTTLDPRVKMTEEELARYLRFRDGYFWVVQGMSLLTVVSNAFIIAVIPRYKSVGVPHVYMLAMAVCDLIIGLCSAWKKLSERLNHLTKTAHFISSYTYWAVIGLDSTSSTSAALILMFLSVDRCLALKYPIKHKVLWSAEKAKILSVTAGLLAFVVGLYYPLAHTVSKDFSTAIPGVVASYTTQLGENEVFNTVARVLEFVLRFAIPLAVTVVSNTITLAEIRKSDSFRKNEIEGDQPVRNTKCLTLTIGVVILFFFTQVLWGGVLVDGMIFTHAHRGTFVMECVVTMADMFVKFNSLSNFFIYFGFSTEFRITFMTLFGCKKEACKRDWESPVPESGKSVSQETLNSSKNMV